MFNGRSIPSASSVTGILLGIIAATPALPNSSATESRALGRLSPSPGHCCCLSMLDFCSLPAAHSRYVSVSPARAVCPPTSGCRGSGHPWVSEFCWIPDSKSLQMPVIKDPRKAWKCCFLINNPPVCKRHFPFCSPSHWGHQLLKSHLFSARSPEIILYKD